MPYPRPLLTQLIDRIQTDIETRLPGADARLRRALLTTLARAEAGAVHGLYGYIESVSRNIVPDTAEGAELDRHAAWWGVPRLTAAPATGSVTFTGTDGNTVPAASVLQRSDGVQYTVDTAVTITASTATASVTAVTGGQTTNATAGQSLTLVSPVAGVQSTATVTTAGLSGGTDSETDDALRTRLRQRVQQRPQGGALADYRTWALEVAGVTRVWPLPAWNGLGTVGLAFTRDNDASIIPDAAEVQTVQDYIDARRPVTAALSVFAPTAAPQAMTIKLAPNTVTVQSAVETELADLFRREAAVEDGTGSGKILLSHIEEAISIAAGETDHVLVTPVADITLAVGDIATLGALTWQTL